MALIKLGFIAPRKKLISNLAIGTHLPKEQLRVIFSELNLDENLRPADLAISDWVMLEKNIHKH
jgi:16S rRNA A1518/A1519 N6-dimethyltransferase RsmA/KsgA/DIM1 with predicted DNA glycosylase/AP lyase activity